uniref:DDE Tnp4 domain-containing protein n=1 Tax=Pelodiscus sinensis TaxID=13735 RepID=K7FC41_PELSI
MRPAIPLQRRLAIALWKLSTPDSYRSIGNQFGVGKSTVGAVLMQVIKAINQVLLRRVVHLADPDVVIQGFGALGFPNCGGAIDGTHIPIHALEHQASLYINRKGYFSVILQAMSDHRGQFMDINVGWSGKAHDARVFYNSSMCRRLHAGTFFPDHHIRSGTWTCPCAWWGMPPTHCSVCLVEDAAYPLQPWLMKLYTGHLNPSRQAFNARLTRAHIVVEGAFSQLKARLDASSPASTSPTTISLPWGQHVVC